MPDSISLRFLTTEKQHAQLYLTLPGATPLSAWEEAGKTDLVLIDAAAFPENWNPLAISLLKKRIAILLDHLPETVKADTLLNLGAIARRNHIAAAVLGSWRFHPAIAALKEICTSGCLGKEIRLTRFSLPCTTEKEFYFANDLHLWLTGRPLAQAFPTLSSPETPALLNLRMEGTAGSAEIHAPCNGNASTATVAVPPHRHQRHIPQASPQLLEYGVLRHLLPLLPADRRLHALPLLMPL